MIQSIVRRPTAFALAVCLWGAAFSRPCLGYVEVGYSLGRVVNESTHVMLVQVESVDAVKNLIIYRKVRDIKGKHPEDVIRHNIGRGGFHPREWQTIMNWAQPGKMAVFMHNGGASETCIDRYWYQAYAGGGGWWGMSHGEPYLLRTFAGRPEKLAAAAVDLVAGKEIVVPCMVDGDKKALSEGTARIQRLKASLARTDYNSVRDFVGWGGDDLQSIAGMPAFSRMAQLSRVDPGARGVALADVNGDKIPEFCVYGESGVTLMQVAGPALNEISLPYSGGARSAQWADYNGDGRPDLLLATPAGPRLLTNLEEGFVDNSGGLPHENYYNTTAAAWIDYDLDGRPDILLANGFLGLRLYRNLGPDAPTKPVAPAVSPWYYAGPFDYAGGRGFDTPYKPEQAVNLKDTYVGKGGEVVAWKKGDFKDGQVNSLTTLFKPQHQTDSVCYLYREFDFGGSVQLPISLGSDDTLTVWLNGKKVLSENVQRGCAADQNLLTLTLRPGPNQLLLKICQGGGDYAFYFSAKRDLPQPVPPLFVDVTQGAGLGPQGLGGRLRGEHLAVADLNGDGRMDFIFVGQTSLTALGTPREFVAGPTPPLQSGDGAPTLADVDGDKLPDLLVPHARGCRLLKNMGQGRFADVTSKAGDLANPFPYAATIAWSDFDGDKRPDVFVGCLKGPNRFFRYQQDGTFVEAGASLGLQTRIFNSRGIAVADVNEDGAPDMVLANEGQPSVVLLGTQQQQVTRVP